MRAAKLIQGMQVVASPVTMELLSLCLDLVLERSQSLYRISSGKG